MKRILLVSACLLLAGCVSSQMMRLDRTDRPVRSPDSVAVLLEMPDQPYTVIATITCTGKSVFDTYEDLRQRMIADAAQIGGDALILGPESTESMFLVLPPALIQSDRRELTAAVVVFDRPQNEDA